MAVEAFLKPGDVKISVEKKVKQKPSVEELTTIESPGRPSPASFLEESEKSVKRTRKTKKNFSDDVNVSSAKKDSVLIITEKPQAALKIANSLGSSRKYSEDGVNYYEVSFNGENVLVASAVGHLFNLT